MDLVHKRMKDYETQAADVRNRINLLLKEKGLTQNSVAAGDASAQKRLNSQLSHGSNITLDTVLRVLEACQDIAADWLLRGSGDMYRRGIIGANTVNSHNENANINDTDTINRLLSMLETKDKQMEAKENQVNTLLEIIKNIKVG
jgi:hypothetical protein